MPAINAEQIKLIIAKIIPVKHLDNPFIKALLAGATAVTILLATPAFAPIGVVGATGWIIVYVVTGGTLSMDIFKKAWNAWKEMDESERNKIDDALARLKRIRDENGITEEEYRTRVRELLDKKMH